MRGRWWRRSAGSWESRIGRIIVGETSWEAIADLVINNKVLRKVMETDPGPDIREWWVGKRSGEK